IYQLYVIVENGYVFNFQSGKLTATNNKLIDLALMSTCRLVAEEMKGVALRTNTITFTTVYTEDMRKRAGRFNSRMAGSYNMRSRMLEYAWPCITTDIYHEVAREYPRFLPLLD
ncbi:hypothetical protein QBC33DRAFT_423222, partial [Phialemonium atrogriseum]